MKGRVLVHKFNLPVFKATVYIVVGSTMKVSLDWAEDKTCEVIEKEEFKKFVKAYMYGYKNENNKSVYMLLFKYTATVGEIAHEVKHLINTAFQWHGQKLSTSNDEMECYYLEDIMNRAYNTVKRYKKLYKSKSK